MIRVFFFPFFITKIFAGCNAMRIEIIKFLSEKKFSAFDSPLEIPRINTEDKTTVDSIWTIR